MCFFKKLSRNIPSLNYDVCLNMINTTQGYDDSAVWVWIQYKLIDSVSKCKRAFQMITFRLNISTYTLHYERLLAMFYSKNNCVNTCVSWFLKLIFLLANN